MFFLISFKSIRLCSQGGLERKNKRLEELEDKINVVFLKD